MKNTILHETMLVMEKLRHYINFSVLRGYSLRITYILVILLGLTIEFLSIFSNISPEIYGLLVFPVLVSKEKLHLVGKIFLALISFISLLMSTVFLIIYTNVIILLFYLCLICAVLYYCLFRWRKLPFSYFSCICFSINFLIFCSFIFGIINIFLGLPKPIYIEDLSEYSYYKYTGFFIISIIGAACYLIIKFFFPYILNLPQYKFLRISHLKENIVSLLDTWKDSFFDDFHYKLLINIYRKRHFRNSYFSMVFVFIYLIRLLQAILFCNFVFFHGDLRLNFYLLPLSFLSWCLTMFEQYFKRYVEESFNYCRLLLDVTSTDADFLAKENIALIMSDKLLFGLTEFAYENGYTDEDLPKLVDIWLEGSDVFCRLKIYASKLFYFNICITILRILSWFGLTYLLLSDSNSSFLVITLFLNRFSPGLTRCSYSSRAHRVLKSFENHVASQTENAFAPGHLLSVDTDVTNDKKQVKVEGAFTHGPGSKENPSVPLHSSKDFKGPNIRGQRYIRVKTPTHIDSRMIGPAIPGSEQFLEEAECKVNLAKAHGDYYNREEEYS